MDKQMSLADQAFQAVALVRAICDGITAADEEMSCWTNDE